MLVASAPLEESALEAVAGVRNPAKAAHLGVPVVNLDLDKFETLRRLSKASTGSSWRPLTPLTCSAKAKTW